MNQIICEAIRARSILEFDYGDHHRVVEPYCHGTSTSGNEVLRAIQIAGSSSSGGFGFGKLWTVSKMRNLRRSAATFVGNDPGYNPADSAMRQIHCHL